MKIKGQAAPIFAISSAQIGAMTMTIQPQLRPKCGKTKEYTTIPSIHRIKTKCAMKVTRLESMKPLSFISLMSAVTPLDWTE